MSVIVCTYSSTREALLRETVRSLERQERTPDEVIVVVDHNPRLFRTLRTEMPDVVVVENSAAVRGISGARNTGFERATGSVIAFVDDDATARPEWLKELLGSFVDPAVLVAGSQVLPRWDAGPPRWFPIEFGWVLGCSYRGQLASDGTETVRNVYANGMAARRAALQVGSFDAHLGRVGSVPLGCEETEWCIRVSRTFPSSKIVQVPTAILDHFVPAGRTAFGRFTRHCFAEGLSKAAVASLVGTASALASERRYMATTLPAGIARRAAGAARGDLAQLLQAGAIGIGLTSTGLGYALGRLRGSRPSNAA